MNAARDKNDLRTRAESHYRACKAKRDPPPEPIDQLVHELEVHQIELEMQNEALQHVRSELETSLVDYQDLFDLAPVGYLKLRANGTIVNTNLTFADLLGSSREQLRHSNVKRLIIPQDQDTLFQHLRNTFGDESRQICEVELIRSNGSTFPAQLESVCHTTQQQCLMVVTDITERRRQEALIHRQAYYDPLTDLPNRTLFLDRLAYNIRTAQRESSGLALFYLDLDNFKWINDTHGHAAGDMVLVECARRFTACARETDTVARLSGDEFCIILPLISNVTGARVVAQKVLSSMQDAFVLTEGISLRVTCSIGIAMYPQDCNGADDLLQSADLALYQVKRSCRGQYHFFSKALNEGIARTQQLGLELDDAIRHDELTLRYQPVIELESRRTFGAEVLVRWEHPQFGLLPPSDFIPVAESTGAIVELGEWVLQRVCEQARMWHDKGIGLTIIWVNLSVRQCSSLDHLDRLARQIEQMHDWPAPPRIGLEITESDVLEFSDTSLARFAALRRSGVSLSVDDFGIGYSSLERLLHLPFDIIKIDKSFVTDIVHSEKSANLVRAVITLGHAMDTRVIAEGIETRAQLEKLRNLGCDFGQGFHIAKPMTSEALVDFHYRF